MPPECRGSPVRIIARALGCAAALGLPCFLAADEAAPKLNAAATTQPSSDLPPPIPGYVLAWHDEFDGPALDSTRWKPWALGKRRDALNVADAIRFDGDGHLVLTTRRVQTAEGKTEYHTGGVWTSGLYEPCFGYLEARLEVHKRGGHWCAFWLNSNGMGKPVGDPAKAGVEMDIMEYHHRLDGGRRVQQTLHWDGYGADHKTRGHTPLVQGITAGFHTYGLLWTKDEYVFFVDGVETWRVTAKDGGAISNRPEHMILSLEVGDWAGPIDKVELPDSIRVDWVRVWQQPP